MNDSYLFIRIPKDMKDKLDARADEESQSTAVFVRALINKAIKKKG